MGFDLVVLTGQRPADLATRWEEALAAQGLQVEIYPGFDLASSKGGFVPFRLDSAPRSLIGMDLTGPNVTGFELYADKREVTLTTRYPPLVAEVTMQCLGAATLAAITGGTYEDPQRGARYKGLDAIEAALEQIAKVVASAKPSAFIQHPFPGWAALGIDSASDPRTVEIGAVQTGDS
ncbi:hypothetical protein [Actinoplanes regularis]|uniref:hypothetical protein n=1 Tax=Actinoplanes regularis TaxID=52697 RepID=UPI002553D751|nr:hypothetical protein [Actinoplanes regularis]